MLDKEKEEVSLRDMLKEMNEVYRKKF